ncbi:MAG: hypothetical protein ACYC2Z_08025 [Candidatus Nanopelagicales bacterium]
MVRQAFTSHGLRALAAISAAAAILASSALVLAAPASPVPVARAASWGTDLAAAGLGVRTAARARDVEALESAVSDSLRTLDRLSKQPKATQASVAVEARKLRSITAQGAVTSYLLRVKDCKQNSLARMAGIAKRVRDGRSTLLGWIGAGDRKWLKDSLAELDKALPACLHLTLTFDSFMALNDPQWEVAGQFEVPLAFKMDPSGKAYWAGKQTGIVANVTLANADGCSWTVDPKPFTFDVRRLELDFNSILGTTSDVNLKEYTTDVTMVDTATAVCPDRSPPPVPIWGWSMIFADMRGVLASGTWPELVNWQVPGNDPTAEMYKVLKGTTSSSGFTESSTLFLYRR